MRPRDSCRPRARTLRPREHRAVRLRRVGGSEDERLGLVLLARAQLTQPLDSPAQRELGSAETFHEVAAPAGAERLERAQLSVDRAVAAGDSLGADGVARHDAVPFQQELGKRSAVGLAAVEERSRERPAPLGRGRAVYARAREAPSAPIRPRRLVAAFGAQRRPGVVRHLAAPDQIPQRRQRCLGFEHGRSEEAVPEQRTAGERSADRIVRIAVRSRRRGRPPEQRRVVAEEGGNAVETGSDPDELAGGAELVELFGPVVGHAPRQHLRLPQRDRQRERLQRDERLAQRRAAVDTVPAREEPPERRLLHRLHLAPQCGERRAAQPAQDVGVAPLALRPARPELAADELLVALEHAQLILDVDAEPRRRLSGRERAAAARPAGDERPQRIGHRLEEHRREARRRHDAERVAVAACILGRRKPLLAGDAARGSRAAPPRGSPRAPRRTRRRAGRLAAAANRRAARDPPGTAAATPRPRRAPPDRSSSRSSSWPSSSRSRSRSSESACARRSAGGVSSSYM